MTNVFKIVSITLILLFTSCKSSKSITSSGVLKAKLSSRRIINEHSKQAVQFKTLQARVKVEYIQGNRSQTHTVNLRMERDKTIWLSATLGIVRAKITPTRFRFYNKLDHTFFDDDFSLISNLLGTELDFNKLQSLLLGESLFNLKESSYKTSIHEKSYVLYPRHQNALLEIFLLFNPSHFKMDSQQLTQPLKGRMLQIDYPNYQEVERQVLPRSIKIIALEGEEEIIIKMEFKSISLNSDLRFPFRIPSGFDKIVLNDEM